MRIFRLIFLLLLSGCAQTIEPPSGFVFVPITAGQYTILTAQRLTDTTSPIHIYIEGDGNSFDARGYSTDDPTPTGTLVRDLAMHDTSPNVVYMARPCQYIMSDACRRSDWTIGRFSDKLVKSMSDAISDISHNRPVVLIGYSGGAMISGLVITHHPEINVLKWVTIAGVLNHGDWTEYFGDTPLSASLDMDTLPHIPQLHIIAIGDRVVPNLLSERWVGTGDLVRVPNARHNNFPMGILTHIAY